MLKEQVGEVQPTKIGQNLAELIASVLCGIRLHMVPLSTLRLSDNFRSAADLFSTTPSNGLCMP